MFNASFRGGARVGWVNASWPFARLTANASTLALSSLGTYTFTPSQVIALEPRGSLPIVSSGIRINHNRTDYPKTIIFWCTGPRDAILREIASTGFHPMGQAIGRTPGFPFRWSAIFVAIALWNALFLLDRVVAGWKPQPPGLFALTALVLALIAASATRASAFFQRIVLRDGHEIGEVSSFLVLLQIVTSVSCIALGITFLGKW